MITTLRDTFKRATLALVLVGIAMSSVMVFTSFAEEDDEMFSGGEIKGAKHTVVHLYSPDYPYNEVGKYPTHAAKTTEFWRLLDKNLRAHSTISLSENVEEADYRVEMKCAGIRYCSKFKIYVMSPKRDVLAAYSLKHTQGWFSKKTMDRVALDVAQTLQHKIEMLDEGGYGYTRGVHQ